MRRNFLIAASAGFVLTGCGGVSTLPSSSGPSGVTGTVDIPVAEAPSPNAITTTDGTETPVTFSSNGTSVSAVIPGGENVAAGATVYLIPNVLPVDVSTSTAAMSQTTKSLSPRTFIPAALIPGEFYFQNSDGTATDTGLHLTSHRLVGHTNSNFDYFGLSYPVSGSTRSVSLFVAGPLVLGTRTAGLTISDRLQITFEMSNNGALGSGRLSTYPTHTQYILPRNGRSTYNTLFLAVFSPLPSGVSVPASLTVEWPGVTKMQSRLSNGGQVFLFDGTNSSSGDLVPPTGIARATMAIGGDTQVN